MSEDAKVTRPLASVIIPTYGTPDTLVRAVLSALAQDDTEVEVIVVDDNDPASEGRRATEAAMARFADEPHVSYLRHERNRGGSAARNTGARVAHGTYLCFLDDDDVMLPGRVRACADALGRSPLSPIALTDVVHRYAPGHANYYAMDAATLTPEAVFSMRTLIGTGSNLLVPRWAFDRVAGFDEDFPRHQDLEFAVRILALGPAAVVPRPLIVKATNATNNVPAYARMRDVKRLYNERLAFVLDAMDAPEREAYLSECHRELFRSALLTATLADARAELAESCLHGGPCGAKERLQLAAKALGAYRLVLRRRGTARIESNGTEALVEAHPEAIACLDRLDALAREGTVRP